MTWITEYQMGSDELQCDTSGEFNTVESGIQEACMCMHLRILPLKQI